MSVRRLITDADIRAGRVASPIVLDAGTLLTPSARDRAVAMGLEIVERDGLAGPPPCSRCGGTLTPAEAGCTTCGRSPCACASGSCGESCTSCDEATRCEHAAPAPTAESPTPPPAVAASSPHTCARTDALGDGLWLVRVENGVAVSVLPASGAGQLTRSRQG